MEYVYKNTKYIIYPDGEKVTYGYDAGGQVVSVTGEHFGKTFNYVTNILYDEYGQRTHIDYGNGTFTEYSYDKARRWLDTIKTQNKWGKTYQNIVYSFDKVGNVLGYENDCLSNANGNYRTAQNYEYDALYQLTKVSGETVYNPYASSVPEFKSNYSQNFSFDADGLGNMTSKVSAETVTPEKSVGDNLNYAFNYVYDENFAHRLLRAGERYYKYDANGNVICEQDGSFDLNGDDDATNLKVTKETDDVYSTDYGWGLFKETDEDSKSSGGSAQRYKRTYAWNERNQLVSSVDANYSTAYIYGQDGERTNKYTSQSETLYFNKMWTLHTDSGNAIYGGQSAKNIYLGETRIVTKLNSGENPTYSEEYNKQYFYHSDHLGSASLISDYKGDEYQRIEYTPYGETWVEKTQNTGLEFLPYKFTGKEQDEETGLYYYGARYLDSRYSRWISTDPALGDYVPQAPISDEAKKHNQNLPGMGGVFNHINGNLYHYAGNNPVRYVDPDGKITQHKDLKGSDRVKAEVKDIFQGSFKIGIFAGVSASLSEIVSVGAEVDCGSIECSGSLNNDVKTVESAGVDFELGILEFAKGNLNLKKEREIPKNEKIGNYFQTEKDIFTKGEFSPDIGVKVGPISTSGEDKDIKVGGEIGLCLGIGLWINLSEIKDFVKGWINGEY